MQGAVSINIKAMCLCQQEFSKGFTCKIALFYDLKSYIQSQQMQFCFQAILEKRYVKKADLSKVTHAHARTRMHTFITHAHTLTQDTYIQRHIVYIYIIYTYNIYIHIIYIYIKANSATQS